MRKHSRTKQCIEPMTSCTSKNISLSNFSSSESSQIDDYIVPQNIFLKDSNMFSGSEEMVSNCLYSDITNNLKLKNQDNIINEKVKHFLKYTQPLNSSQKLDNIDNYNLLNYSDMQHKSCLLSSPDENVNNNKPYTSDQNNKRRSKSNRAVCWGEYVECYRYQLDSSLSTIDLQMERCKTDEPSRTKSQTHTLNDEYKEPYDEYNNNQKQRNEMPEVKNVCRPIMNYNLNHSTNQSLPNYIRSKNSSCTNKTIKRSNFNRKPEYLEWYNEENSSQQPECSEWYPNDSNRQPEYLEWQHKDLNQKSEYMEWPNVELNRLQYQKSRKSEKSKLESHQNITGNKYIWKSHVNDNEESIDTQPCTTDMITITNKNNIKVKKNVTSQKHNTLHTKEPKKSSEKKNSNKDFNEKCKLCDLVHIDDEILKNDKHESSINTIGNSENEYAISNEQREMLRKMFHLKPEDKNVLLMLRLE